ncbi:hypothetical protein SLEP1_g49618 [Rubroshorea leprosula]|uniref:Uncharacterized protein n=1 Tax=Rubroshorea leprosula TaxID=152421 RepID=A0AAV5LXP2_9ROSI|nr:hypothetical protein SLEP1_g49618 [Rubroshorea leprosula]
MMIVLLKEFAEEKKEPSQADSPTWKIGKEAWIFPFFSCPKTRFELRNLPPYRENPDLLCSSSSPPAALALWGVICSSFCP